jgi:hypothetical protein
LVLEKEGFIPLQVIGENDYALSHREDGVCHFYQDDLCELHRSHGVSHKPVVCQLYPFTLVSTPQGIFVSLLYSCPAVVSGTGADAGEQREALTQLFELHDGDVPQIPASKSHILVTTRTKISWLEYNELEQQFIRLVDSSDPVGSLLKMVELLLPGADESELPNQLMEIAQVVRTNLLGDEFKMTEFRILKPTTTIERDCIRRFLLHQIHGKLLIVGPTLVSQLLIYAVSMAIFLDVLEQQKRRSQVLHFSFEHLYFAFELLEEELLSQSSEFEKQFLDWEALLESRRIPAELEPNRDPNGISVPVIIPAPYCCPICNSTS